MRKILIHLLNVAGLALLISAVIVAWNDYNPIVPTPPADVTIVTAGETPNQLPPSENSSQTNGNATPPAPAVLPETKAPVEPQPEKRQEQAPSLADRKANYRDLAAARAQAFPPPAHSLPNRIVLPSINVDSPVIEIGWKVTQQNGQLISEWEVADFAAGFHKNSALPGAVGNTVISGHNNIKGEVFKNLIDLKVGDEIFVFADNKTYRYIVAQKLLVKERDAPMEQRLQNAQWIALTDDVRLTLISCWPYTSNTHRVIIVAKPAS